MALFPRTMTITRSPGIEQRLPCLQQMEFGLGKGWISGRAGRAGPGRIGLVCHQSGLDGGIEIGMLDHLRKPGAQVGITVKQVSGL